MVKVLMLFFPSILLASELENDMQHRMTNLILQLAILILLAKLGGSFAKKLKLPSVLGELFMGMLVSPYFFENACKPLFFRRYSFYRVFGRFIWWVK